MGDLEKIRSKMEKDLKTGFLSIIVLLVISRSNKPSYGYRIIKSLGELTDGKLAILEGTIYILLKSLENQELISSYWGPSEEGGPPRRYYEITRQGRLILEIGLQEWKNLTDIQNRIISRLEGRQ